MSHVANTMPIRASIMGAVNELPKIALCRSCQWPTFPLRFDCHFLLDPRIACCNVVGRLYPSYTDFRGISE